MNVVDPNWTSVDRFAEYLTAAGDDESVAAALYAWNARVSAALFEVVHHFEVLLRNAIARELESAGFGSMTPGTPWVQNANRIEEVTKRIERRGSPVSPGRVYAGLSFGFWQGLFKKEYEELWRHSLRFVFRHGRVDRSIIAAYLDSVGFLRNRIAHHGSMLDLNTEIEYQKIYRLASWIDPAAAAWIKGLEQVTRVSNERPVLPNRNVLVAAASLAWPLYRNQNQAAYFFPANRSIQVVEYVGFYADYEVKPLIAKVLRHHDAVDWTEANARRLLKSMSAEDKQLGGVITVSLKNGWATGVNQVLILSDRSSVDTVKLSQPLIHEKRGRGSAFVQSHRYFPLSALKSAGSTADL